MSNDDDRDTSPQTPSAIAAAGPRKSPSGQFRAAGGPQAALDEAQRVTFEEYRDAVFARLDALDIAAPDTQETLAVIRIEVMAGLEQGRIRSRAHIANCAFASLQHGINQAVPQPIHEANTPLPVKR